MKSQTEAEKRQQWLTLQIGLQTQMEILQASTTWSQVCNWQTIVTMLDSFFLWVMLLKQATISSFFLQETNNQLDLVQMQWSQCKTESAYFTMYFIPEKKTIMQQINLQRDWKHHFARKLDINWW